MGEIRPGIYVVDGWESGAECYPEPETMLNRECLDLVSLRRVRV